MPRPERARFWRSAMATACFTLASAGNVALAAEPGDPGGESRAVTLNEEGARYYAARDYRRAVEKFIQAYATDSDPNLLFNIASCYEGLGDLDAAVEKYREFLAAPGSDPSGRPHAEAVIARWQQGAAGNREVAPLITPPPAAPPSEAKEEPSASKDTEPEASSSWIPWVTLGGGGVIAVLGGASYMLGARDHSRVTDDAGYDDPNAVSSMTRGEADDLVSSGRLKKQLGVSGLAVGGALVTSYVIWWLLDDPDTSESLPSVSATTSAATVTFAGQF